MQTIPIWLKNASNKNCTSSYVLYVWDFKALGEPSVLIDGEKGYAISREKHMYVLRDCISESIAGAGAKICVPYNLWKSVTGSPPRA